MLSVNSISDEISMEMTSDIKRFVSHSSVYFIGNALNRLGVFVLLPLYTRFLTPGEYGTLELVLVTVSILQTILGMRFGHTTLRFFFEYDNESDRKKLISTSLISIIAWGLLLTGVLISASGFFSNIVYGSREFTSLFVLGFSVMFFEVVSEIPFSYLRAKEHSLIFVLSSLAQMLLRVGLNVYIVISLKKGVEGILMGNLIGAFIVWVFLCGFVFKSVGFSFDKLQLNALWKYCYPLVIAVLPTMVFRNADRVFLGWNTTLETVGLYALAVRFGIALHSFLIEPFQLGYGPFRFSIMKQANAKEVYARIMSYFLFAVAFMGLTMALFAREIIEVMSSSAFHSVHHVIPVVALTVIFAGVVYIFQTGILIEKKTIYMPYISTAEAALNVLFLFYLVPIYGMYGAAFSLLFTTIISSVITLKISQKYYKIEYEYSRLMKIFIVMISLFLLSKLTDDLDFISRVGYKMLIILSFPMSLVLMKFYKQEEIDKISSSIGILKTRLLSTIDRRRKES